jgi:hypothetical protein
LRTCPEAYYITYKVSTEHKTTASAKTPNPTTHKQSSSDGH